jgi:capsular polysaccharide export protein
LLASLDPDYPEAPSPVMVGARTDGLSGRRFLIVTAPFGPFGRVLTEALRSRGADVTRMLFNAGDVLYWRGPGALRFKGRAAQWPDQLKALLPGFTDVIVFGEGGAYNQAVLRDGAALGVRVWVLENGYFRPDWVTVERNGVNASSALPRHRLAYEPPIPETR